MAVPVVQTVGYKELVRELKKIDPAWGRELSKIQRELAKWLTPKVQAAAASDKGSTRHFAKSVKGSGTQAGARLVVKAEANAAFWGAKKTTGWNAEDEELVSRGLQSRKPKTPNQRKWIGNTWEVGGATGGPYAINPTIFRNREEIVDRYGDAIEDLLGRAFPTGGSK